MNQNLQDVLAGIASSAEYTGIELTGVEQRGVFGNTPLKVACVRGDAEAVLVLLEAGADVNAIVEDGETALHHAAAQGNVNVLKMLIAHGAATGVRNRFGQTPIELAQILGNVEIVQVLQSQGQSPRKQGVAWYRGDRLKKHIASMPVTAPRLAAA